MIYIVDNFLDQDTLEYLENTHVESLPITWYNLYDDNIYRDICHHMIDVSKKYYNFSSKDIQGYECWSQINSKPDSMHYDKDETMWKKHEKLVFSICSTVLYFNVDDDLNGGLLNIENNIFVKPKTNRFVLFSPGLLHGVEEFTGKRSSFLVNPWKIKPLPY
jgi:hypothetical protein